MKKVFRFLVFLLVSVPICASAESPALKASLKDLAGVKGPFTFVVMGDNRSGDRVYKKIIQQTMLRNPLFVVNTGDLIPNHGNREEWANFKEISRGITVPYFLAVGNHDVDDKKSEDIWREEVDLPGNELYYSFVVGKDLFVILDSCEASEDRRIDGAQFKWLEGTLNPKRYEHQFVFLHHPLFLLKGMSHKGESLDRYPDLRDRLHNLFAERKVDAVFLGHEHTYNRMEKDGVAYIITGGAGAPLYGKESYNNLMVVRVDGQKVEAKVIDREGMMRDEFTRLRRMP